MPLSIVMVPAAISGTLGVALHKFTEEAILVSAEAQNTSNPCEMALYLRISGAVQCCSIPLSHVGPQKVVAEDLKIPVDGKEELVADFFGVGASDVCWLKLAFYIKDGSEKRIWWM